MKNDRRKKKTRTIDRVLERFENYDGPDASEHILNTYRIELLEEAKDELSIATKLLGQTQQENNTTFRLIKRLISLSAALIITVTGLGWYKHSEFIDKIYEMKVDDHANFEKYRREIQVVNMDQNRGISDNRRDLGDLQARFETLQARIELLEQQDQQKKTMTVFSDE